MNISTGFSRLLSALAHIMRSPKFFYGTVIFFVLNAAWFALVSQFPMAFDEDFHVGIIRLYADVWNPFALSQAPGDAVYGAVTVDPSYLFHYLMSFPYRLLAAVIPSEAVVIILLRFLNIALFTVSLFIFRAVLRAANVTPAVSNAVLAVFILIPVVPMVAGQVNYDNLIMPIVAGLFWCAVQLRRGLVERGRLAVVPAALFALLVLFGAVVKYAFLPIAFGVFVVLAFELVRAFRREGKAVLSDLAVDFRRLGRPLQFLLLLGGLLAVLVFAQRYVLNFVRYGDIVPDCAAVLSAERCEAYGPWGRDYRYARDRDGMNVVSLPRYVTDHWAWGMWHRLYFTLAGPTNDYATRRQLPIPSITAIVLVVAATLATLWFAPKLWRNHRLFVLLLVPSILYIGILLMTQYEGYTRTARPVAINGRYLLPLLPLIGAVGGMGSWYAMRALRLRRFAGLIAVVALFCLLQGGGALTYIYYSEPAWLWQHPAAQEAQRIAQPVVRSFLIGR